MRTRYPIDRSFGIFSRVSPPFGRGIFALARAALSLVPKGSRGVSVRRVDAGGVRAFLISPKGEKGRLPCLVYFHGGGFVFKAARYHYRNAAAYAQTGCRVLFVDYRLAPNYPCPAPNEDCFAAYAWAAEHAAELAVDPARLAVGGDSAGGCLAADVSFFPPTYLETAQFDCLHDEGVTFAGKLREQHVPVTLRETSGTMHGHDIVRKSAITQESVMARCAALKAALGTRSDQSRQK